MVPLCAFLWGPESLSLQQHQYAGLGWGAATNFPSTGWTGLTSFETDHSLLTRFELSG